MDNKGSISQPHVDEQFFTRGPGTNEDFNPDISGSINTNVNFASPSGQEIGNKVSGIFSENVSDVMTNSPESAPAIAENEPSGINLGDIVSVQMPPSYTAHSVSSVADRDYNHTSVSDLGEDIVRKFNGDGNPITLIDDIINAKSHYDEIGRR